VTEYELDQSLTRMTAKTPVEIIFFQQFQKDLTKTVRVSRSFLAIARPILYRKLHLRGSCNPETFHLLEKDVLLSQNIIELKFESSIACRVSSWAYLAGMSNLKLLDIGYVFDSAEEWNQFFRVVSQSCPHLRILRFDASWNCPVDELRFEIAGLERITWDSMARTSVEPVLSLLNNSISTITHISIPSLFDPVFFDWLPLFSYRFPVLRSFEMGSFSFENVEEDTIPFGAAMTQFLLAHPLIEHLSLSNDGIQLVWSDCTPQMLPHLRNFVGSTNYLMSFTERDVHSLKQLEILSPRCTWEPYISVHSILFQFAQFGGLPSLKQLDLDDTREEKGESVILLVAQVAPALEQLIVRFNIDWTLVSTLPIYGCAS
jgi:hypothetical protein